MAPVEVNLSDFTTLELVEGDDGGVQLRIWDGDTLILKGEAAERATIRYFVSKKTARWFGENEPDYEHSLTFSGSRLALEVEDVLTGLSKPHTRRRPPAVPLCVAV